VIIQQNTPTRDTYGAEVASWSALATVWGAVEPLRGREFFDAQAVNAEVTTRIRIRYRSGVVPTMRVVWGSHTYDILSVVEIETRQRELHLMCKELL
jgi:SPP1 family predicted phage head-tail adaptor